MRKGGARLNFAKTIVVCANIALAATSSAAWTDVLASGQDWREIAFDVVELKPMIAARVGDVTGRMMFDTGTPEAVFLNRNTAPVPEGMVVSNGFAASGQAIEVRLHDAPPVQIGGLPFDPGTKLLSGDFGFVQVTFGADYLGFIGTPFVSDGAFALDYGRGVLTIFRTDDQGAMAVPPPAAKDVVAQLTFAMIPGEQPTTGAFIGSLPVVLDFDTGDSGTFYLRPATRARLEEEGLLVAKDGDGTLSSVTFGGASFDGLAVRLILAGGPQDKRPWPGSDSLRLGAEFLSTNPSFWNFPAETITFLRPDAAFLAPR